MVAVRLLVLLAALAIVGETAKYDIFDVIEKLTTLTKQDIIDRIKASEQASRLGVKNDDVIRLNGPLWSKFQTLRARLKTMTEAEQSVVRRLFSIARDVLERRMSDADVSERIVEAFQNGGQGLCARYQRLDRCSHLKYKVKAQIADDLCKPKAQPTVPGGHPATTGPSGHPATTGPSGHPATTGPSASSDENLDDLVNALEDAALIKVSGVSDLFKDSLNEAQKHQQAGVLSSHDFKRISKLIGKDIAKIKVKCIESDDKLNGKISECKTIYRAIGKIIDNVYDLATVKLPQHNRWFKNYYKNKLSIQNRYDETGTDPGTFVKNAINFADIISTL
ncbi:unnamed protein product [Nippostrongylus brasiliensis]|uniref:Uncharacterized protein n=1 Tax=Nippostrongylus brasiliensis TaxID=27835 RepID=A0A0N4YGC4_NIPBR|nr:unnamed protein product [Nippostrongylus brasiliensis]